MNDEKRRARLAPSALKASADPDEWESFPSETDSPVVVEVDGDLGLDSFAEEASPSSTPARPIPLRGSAAVAAVAVALLAGLGYLLISGSKSILSSTKIPAQSGPFIATSPHPIAQVPPAVSMTVSALAPAPRLSEPGAIRPRAAIRPVAPIEARSVALAPSLPSLSAPIASSSLAEPVPPEPQPTLARADTPDTAPDRSSAEVAGLERDEGEIRNLLEAYRQSYLRLDAVSTAKLWPGVDTAALARAFGTIASQQLDFERCAFDVSGQRAKAHCQGSLQYVRRVGNATPQSREMSWAFELDRSSGRWLIDRVTTQ